MLLQRITLEEEEFHKKKRRPAVIDSAYNGPVKGLPYHEEPEGHMQRTSWSSLVLGTKVLLGITKPPPQ